MRGSPLPSKHVATKAVLGQINMMQNQLGTTFKAYHSHNAKEVQWTSLKDARQLQGTTLTTTAHHSTEQKGLVERRFRPVFNDVWPALALSHNQKPTGRRSHRTQLTNLTIWPPDE